MSSKATKIRSRLSPTLVLTLLPLYLTFQYLSYKYLISQYTRNKSLVRREIKYCSSKLLAWFPYTSEQFDVFDFACGV